MSLNKESKLRILESFHSLDYTYFGKTLNKVKTNCCPALKEEYVATKGALLSIMIEMFKLVDHEPKAIVEKVDSKAIRKLARESAKIARENCKKLAASPKGKSDVKHEVAQVLKTEKIEDVDSLVENTIRTKAMNLAIDNLLIARTISEAKNYKQLNDWEGKLLEESYKILRDDLTETALMILDSGK